MVTQVEIIDMIKKEKKRLATRERISVIPIPEQTRTYHPVGHIELVDLAYERAKFMGLKVDINNEQLITAKEGQQVFGTVPIIGNDYMDNKVDFMLGFRNSYDKSLSAGICFGSQVLVCSNLCFAGYAGEYGFGGKISHKHTSRVFCRLVERLDGGLRQFDSFRQFQERFFERLQDTPITDDRAYGTVIRAAQQDAITSSDILTVARHWKFQEKRPEVEVVPENWHEDFQDRNAWSLFNCITEVHKKGQERNFETSIDRSMALTKVFQDEFSEVN